jgi:hypothetical protein
VFCCAGFALHKTAQSGFLDTRFLADSVSAFAASAYLFSYQFDQHNLQTKPLLAIMQDKIA